MRRYGLYRVPILVKLLISLPKRVEAVIAGYLHPLFLFVCEMKLFSTRGPASSSVLDSDQRCVPLDCVYYECVHKQKRCMFCLLCVNDAKSRSPANARAVFSPTFVFSEPPTLHLAPAPAGSCLPSLLLPSHSQSRCGAMALGELVGICLKILRCDINVSFVRWHAAAAPRGILRRLNSSPCN